MKPNAVKKAMIQAAVTNGINDIKDDPKRGIRNLVELGGMFAGGNYQKDFFETALDQLQDENSAYYQIVYKIVQNTNTHQLSTFGMNLGYNALSYGAGMIRSTEAKEGFNVPWCLSIDTGQDKILLPVDIDGAIEEGKELGIYCYIVRMQESYPELEGLLATLGRQRDCAFIVLVAPRAVKGANGYMFVQPGNMLPLVDLDGVDIAAQQAAVQILQGQGCFCGGYTSQPDLQAADVTPALLGRAEELGLPLQVFVRTKIHRPYKADAVYNRFVAMRENLTTPVLPLDLYGDMAHVDRAISSEACFATIKGDGSLAFTNVDKNEEISAYNIHEISLIEALRRTMPKTKTGTP